MSRLFAWSGQSTGVSALASVLQWTPRTDLFRMDWLDLLAVQGTLKSLLQHRSSKASILLHSAFFTVQLSHPFMTTGKTIALTRQTFVGKVMSLLLNMLSRLVITLLPRSKRILISWLQSPYALILEPPKIKSMQMKNNWHSPIRMIKKNFFNWQNQVLSRTRQRLDRVWQFQLLKCNENLC